MQNLFAQPAAPSQVAGSTVDSCFVLVRTHQHGITFSHKQRLTRTRSENCFKAEPPLHACGSLVRVCQTYLRQCDRRENPKEDQGVLAFLWTWPCNSLLVAEKLYVLMSPNKDSSYLHCSYSGEAGCAHACRLWPKRRVEFGWFLLSTTVLFFKFFV